MNKVESQLAGDVGWQRLSPLAIVFFTFRSFSHLINLYPAFIGVFVTASYLDWGIEHIVPLGSAAIAILLLLSTLEYLNFYFILRKEHFLIRSGVLSKQRIELPFKKIQNVSIKQPFYYRPFGLVVLSVDGAGSAQKEIDIAALGRVKANEIKQDIQQKILINDKQQLADEREIPLTPPLEETLITRSTRDIILHGFTHNRAWFLLVLLAPIFNSLEKILGRIFEFYGINIDQWLQANSVFVLTIFALFLFAAVVLLFSLVSIVGSILALYNYRLRYSSNTYTRKSGLLNKYEIQLKHSRIQNIRYQKNWLDCAFNRLVMVLEPFSMSKMEGQPGSLMKKILVPSINEKQFFELAGHVLPGFVFQESLIRPISFYYVVRTVYFRIIPIASLCMLLAVFHGPIWLIPGLLAACLLYGYRYQRYTRYGWYQHGDYLVIRKGFIGKDFYCFAKHKIQQIQFRQSLFLKNRKLACVRFVLASRAVELLYIDEKQARAIVNSCLYEAEFSGKSWM